MEIWLPTLIGAGLLLLGIMQYRKVRASGSWPAVAGRVVASKVAMTETQGSEDTADSVHYTPAVTYEYGVGGQMFRSDRLAFVGRSYGTSQAAQQVLQAYPEGGAVTVYFNPAKPGDAVLQRAAAGGRVLMALGGGMVLLGVAALLKK